MAAGLGFKTFTTGEVLTAADTNGYLMQGILVFATEAARNSAITSPQEGQFAFTKDTNSTWFYDGAAWVASGASGDVTGVTAGNGISVTSPTGPVPTVAIDTTVTVDKTTVQTLTNKTLTTPIISSISNTGTLTLPTSTDTLVGRATTDTLTNKTLTSPALTTPTISTATTNGDILYGTGSGALQRLGIGSTAQVLTVASGVPSWATPAGATSGLTFISRTVFSNVASQAFDSVFDSTYINYLVTLDNFGAGTAADDLLLQWRFAGPSTATTADYYGNSINTKYNTATVANSGTSGLTSALIATNSSATSQGSFAYFYCSSVGQSSQYPQFIGSFQSVNTAELFNFGGYIDNARTYTGFLLKSASSNITGTVTIYGLAKS